MSTQDEYKPDRFQFRALATWYGDDERPEPEIDIKLIHAAMALAGESGELCDYVKKAAFKPGIELDKTKLADELGDVFFYVCVIADMLSMTIEDVSAMNRTKLRGGKHGWFDRRPKVE